MNERDFVAFCRATVAEYANEHMDKTDGKAITEEDVHVVWLTKVLQNNKALLSTTLPDGMYYEITYDGDKGTAYVDVYKKCQNFAVVV